MVSVWFGLSHCISCFSRPDRHNPSYLLGLFIEWQPSVDHIPRMLLNVANRRIGPDQQAVTVPQSGQYLQALRPGVQLITPFEVA